MHFEQSYYVQSTNHSLRIEQIIYVHIQKPALKIPLPHHCLTLCIVVTLFGGDQSKGISFRDEN